MTNRETFNEWMPPVGRTYLAPSGRIWNVRSITPRGNRVVLVSDSPKGEHGAVVDITAVSKMITLDAPLSARPAAVRCRRCPTIAQGANPTDQRRARRMVSGADAEDDRRMRRPVGVRLGDTIACRRASGTTLKGMCDD